MLSKLFTNKLDYSAATLDILKLIRSENVGPKTFSNLVKMFGSATEALKHVEEFSVRGGRSRAIKLYADQAIQQELEALEQQGAKLITYLDSNYSKLLLQIADFPPIISYKGNVELLNKPAIALVGARNSSINARIFTTNIAKELVEKYVVVSGLARGIDTAAHTSSLPNTIAVIAGGIDHIYPPENKKLFQQIIEQGLLLAELPVGSKPLAQHFPQRNRIIAGLAIATIVVEAGLKSGSLITANFALEQNREVFAVPGFPLDPRCMGSNKLIKEGASVLTDIADIWQQLANYDQAKILEDDSQFQFTLPTKAELSISAQERNRVIELLSATPVTYEALATEAELPLSVIYTICLELELAGRAASHIGNKISLIY